MYMFNLSETQIVNLIIIMSIMTFIFLGNIIKSIIKDLK